MDMTEGYYEDTERAYCAGYAAGLKAAAELCRYLMRDPDVPVTVYAGQHFATLIEALPLPDAKSAISVV
jgi:hypothetical protein